MIRYFICLSCLMLTVGLHCQTTNFGKLKYLSTLPELLRENSGMDVVSGSDLTYVINDSGSAPRIFGVSVATGKIIQEITLENAENRDWEDLSSRENELFIGDFGNNRNKRKDLVIYWIEDVDTMNAVSESAFAKAISFTLEDQKKFPPKKKHRNFDIEAFFVKGDFFYLFTKNRASKFDGTTNCYKLPIAQGKQIARKIGSFRTCEDQSDCIITSADYDPDTQKMVLLTYDKVFVFSDFEEDNFFDGNITKIKLDYLSQKESIYFKDKNTLIISEETKRGTGGNMYSLQID